MNLKNKDIINCVQGLNLLAQKEFPLIVSIKIENLRRSLEPFAVSSQQMIDNIKKEHAIDVQGNELKFNESDVEEINEQINAIADATKEFDDKLKIPISLFPSEKEISPQVIRLLWEVLV